MSQLVVTQLPRSGSGLPGVNAVAGPCVGDNSNSWPPEILVATYEDASVRLWDTRGPARASITVPSSKLRPAEDAIDVCNIMGSKGSIVLCDNAVVKIDWRMAAKGAAAKFVNETGEVSAMDRRWNSGPSALRTNRLWFIDEDGGIFSLRADTLEPWATPLTRFGAHKTLPCGLAVIEGGDLVISTGMDFTARVYSTADGNAVGETISLGGFERDGGGSVSQIANPPIASSSDALGDAFCVTRGDGSYLLYRYVAEEQSFIELLEASGHASNGLVCGTFIGDDHGRPAALATAAVSGEVFVWDTSREYGLRPRVDDDDDDDDDLRCLFALDVRADCPPQGGGGSAAVSLNCMTVWGGKIVTGDTSGRILIVPFQ